MFPTLNQCLTSLLCWSVVSNSCNEWMILILNLEITLYDNVGRTFKTFDCCNVRGDRPIRMLYPPPRPLLQHKDSLPDSKCVVEGENFCH